MAAATDSLVGAASQAISVVDSRSFYVVGDTKDPKAEKTVQALKLKNPNVMFIISRSKNLV